MEGKGKYWFVKTYLEEPEVELLPLEAQDTQSDPVDLTINSHLLQSKVRVNLNMRVHRIFSECLWLGQSPKLPCGGRFRFHVLPLHIPAKHTLFLQFNILYSKKQIMPFERFTLTHSQASTAIFYVWSSVFKRFTLAPLFLE